MVDPVILIPSLINGLTTGALYALVALGLTLIYGVLHIINFAHGAMLMMALYGVFFLNRLFGIDPYVALLIVPCGNVRHRLRAPARDHRPRQPWS